LWNWYFAGGSLSTAHVIDIHQVNSEAQCFLRCQTEQTCVGFNYKQTNDGLHTENCQLSNSSYEDINQIGNEEWTYFGDIQAVSNDDIKQ
jgi:hypothetical protein